jgi:hypothetical protein
MKVSLLLATVGVAVLLAGPGVARVHRHAASGHHASPVPFGYATQPQVTPQYNNPGPQLSIPQSGNPVEQLAPLESTSPGGIR